MRMRDQRTLILAGFILSAMVLVFTKAYAAVPRELPGELNAEAILNGDYPFPPSPATEVHEDWSGLRKDRLSHVPAPGVHPRILLSPQDLPDLRRRLKETETGRALFKRLQERIDDAIGKPGSAGARYYAGLTGGADDANRGQSMPGGIGHYQPFLYAFVMEAFYSMVAEDPIRGRKVATAIANYARSIEPEVDQINGEPLADNIWRVPRLRDLMGYHLLGYAYDFAYNNMTEEQRTVTRRVIAKSTRGKIWMGATLPHHWRNWNWVMVGLSQPLLALAIEGEEGYDPRVYKLGVQIARDYLAYGISPNGCLTEAVGYSQFGMVWGTPFMVAAARRGDNLLVQSHHRASIDWYIQSMEPFAPAWKRSREGDAEQQERSLPQTWTSHGDGGDEGPAIWTMSMWRYFFPGDPKVDFIWQVMAAKPDFLSGNFHIIEPLLWATDRQPDASAKLVDDTAEAKNLKLPLTWFDPLRSSLIARNEWSTDAALLQFECRTDAATPSHEHADRGNFTFSALGRQWAKESFRSIETRHHNNVLIDGLGQGFWPGPGRWLGMRDAGWALVAACDTKDNYSWWWPKTILTDPLDSARFRFPHWADYLGKAKAFRAAWGEGPWERDPRPAVVEHFKGFEAGEPRMWDEDTWPRRLPHNPVARAFRTLAFVRAPKPYLLVVDDIQKDHQERLYEWNMMTGPNTDVAVMGDNDIILCDATVPRDGSGLPKPKKGDRALLVRVVQMNDPAKAADFQARPSFRLETFEKKDTINDMRSFGRDKRLVIASRSVAPNFKILLFPYHVGDPLPVTTWNDDKSQLTVQIGDVRDKIACTLDKEGRTRLTLNRAGQSEVTIR